MHKYLISLWSKYECHPWWEFSNTALWMQRCNQNPHGIAMWCTVEPTCLHWPTCTHSTRGEWCGVTSPCTRCGPCWHVLPEPRCRSGQSGSGLCLGRMECSHPVRGEREKERERSWAISRLAICVMPMFHLFIYLILLSPSYLSHFPNPLFFPV